MKELENTQIKIENKEKLVENAKTIMSLDKLDFAKYALWLVSIVAIITDIFSIIGGYNGVSSWLSTKIDSIFISDVLSIIIVIVLEILTVAFISIGFIALFKKEHIFAIIFIILGAGVYSISYQATTIGFPELIKKAEKKVEITTNNISVDSSRIMTRLNSNIDSLKIALSNEKKLKLEIAKGYGVNYTWPDKIANNKQINSLEKRLEKYEDKSETALNSIIKNKNKKMNLAKKYIANTKKSNQHTAIIVMIVIPILWFINILLYNMIVNYDVSDKKRFSPTITATMDEIIVMSKRIARTLFDGENTAKEISNMLADSPTRHEPTIRNDQLSTSIDQSEKTLVTANNDTEKSTDQSDGKEKIDRLNKEIDRINNISTKIGFNQVVQGIYQDNDQIKTINDRPVNPKNDRPTINQIDRQIEIISTGRDVEIKENKKYILNELRAKFGRPITDDILEVYGKNRMIRFIQNKYDNAHSSKSTYYNVFQQVINYDKTIK